MAKIQRPKGAAVAKARREASKAAAKARVPATGVVNYFRLKAGVHCGLNEEGEEETWEAGDIVYSETNLYQKDPDRWEPMFNFNPETYVPPVPAPEEEVTDDKTDDDSDDE